jgi:hypothetical protein
MISWSVGKTAKRFEEVVELGSVEGWALLSNGNAGRGGATDGGA